MTILVVETAKVFFGTQSFTSLCYVTAFMVIIITDSLCFGYLYSTPSGVDVICDFNFPYSTFWYLLIRLGYLFTVYSTIIVLETFNILKCLILQYYRMLVRVLRPNTP